MTGTEALILALTEAVQPYAPLLDAAMAEGRLTRLTVDLLIGTKTAVIRDVVVSPSIRREPSQALVAVGRG